MGRVSYNLQTCRCEQVLYMCVITSSALVLVVLSHYCLGGMSVLSLNSMVSPPSKSLEDMDARVSSHQFLVPSWAPATTVSGNLLLMCITYLQIRPHFASPTESNAFTWLHPLFPIICCLSLSVVFTSTRSVLHPLLCMSWSSSFAEVFIHCR